MICAKDQIIHDLQSRVSILAKDRLEKTKSH